MTADSFLPHSLFEDRIFTGAWTRASRNADVFEPATGAVLGRIGLAGPEEIGVASAAAKSAQPGWASKPAEQRATVLRNAAIPRRAASGSDRLMAGPRKRLHPAKGGL